MRWALLGVRTANTPEGPTLQCDSREFLRTVIMPGEPHLPGILHPRFVNIDGVPLVVPIEEFFTQLNDFPDPKLSLLHLRWSHLPPGTLRGSG